MEIGEAAGTEYCYCCTVYKYGGDLSGVVYSHSLFL
jgi:hypothetical protein